VERAFEALVDAISVDARGAGGAGSVGGGASVEIVGGGAAFDYGGIYSIQP
jgi:hypothetical protein